MCDLRHIPHDPPPYYSLAGRGLRGDKVIEFLQIIETILFATAIYHIIKFSPLLEKAKFTHAPALKAVQIVANKQAIFMNKPARRVKVSYTSKFHYAGIPLAH